MVIINEHWATSGRKVYELEEVVSGQRTTWSPPQKLDKARYREALIHVATQFEAAAQQTQDANAVPEVSLGDKEADEATPFGVYATQVFMPRKIPFIAENTRDGWERYLRLRMIPAFGQLAIGSISSGRLTDFLIGMQTQGLAQQTVERYYTLLKGIFKMAKSTGVIQANPMDYVEKPKCRNDEEITTTVDACTAEEIAKIMHCLQREPLKWRVIITLLIETGMRIGECMALQWKDIDWKNNAITIRASLGYTVKKGIYTTSPKNKRTRIVYVSNEMMELLLLHYCENVFGPNSPYVSHKNKSADPMHPQSPAKYLRKFAAKYDLPYLYPHKLRHSYASIAITNGADVASVADNLGHKDSSVTLRIYTCANEASKRKASDICRSAIRNAKAI